MQNIKKHLIIGLTLLLSVGFHASSVHALYSPNISREVSKIKEHVLSAQAQNGDGDLLEIVSTIKTNNELKRQNNQAEGLSGSARVAQQMIIDQTYKSVIERPYDSLSMVFNLNGYNGQFISNCLRDEIWNLEALRDVVGQEMIKSYLLYDRQHGDLLKEDYLYLVSELDLLRKYGADPTAIIRGATGEEMTSTEYFFNIKTDSEDKETVNMYTRKYFHSDLTGCPDGEFEQVFEQVARSWKTFSVLATGRGNSAAWGDIWEMAQANAKVRARQWIQANQFSLTIGGTGGGDLQSLVNSHGWDKFVGNMKTQVEIAKQIVGPVTPLFDIKFYRPDELAEQSKGCAVYYAEDGFFRNCNESQLDHFYECKNNEEAAIASGINCSRFVDLNESRSLADYVSGELNAEAENEEALEEVTSAMVYAITLDSVNEQSLIGLHESLVEMNNMIQQGYEEPKEGGESIPSMVREMKWLAARQCANR